MLFVFIFVRLCGNINHLVSAVLSDFTTYKPYIFSSVARCPGSQFSVFCLARFIGNIRKHNIYQAEREHIHQVSRREQITIFHLRAEHCGLATRNKHTVVSFPINKQTNKQKENGTGRKERINPNQHATNLPSVQTETSGTQVKPFTPNLASTTATSLKNGHFDLRVGDQEFQTAI